jgi:hypothetical protein
MIYRKTEYSKQIEILVSAFTPFWVLHMHTCSDFHSAILVLYVDQTRVDLLNDR